MKTIKTNGLTHEAMKATIDHFAAIRQLYERANPEQRTWMRMNMVKLVDELKIIEFEVSR